MTQKEVLTNYLNSIRKLRHECRESGITEEEFKKLYTESLEKLETKKTKKFINYSNNIRFKYKLIVLLLALLMCIFYCKCINSAVLCNLQEYIYPGLRWLRQISVPLISLFPSLTEFYDETCLIQNPFFTVVDLDCWPCSSITNVRQIYNPTPTFQQYTAPFIYETNQQVINIEEFEELYLKNKAIFDTDAHKVSKDDIYYINPSEMFGLLKESEHFKEGHLFVWKFNRMNPARIIRQLIPRPQIVPKYGQSPERFLIIDTSQKSFKVPDTECSFSFLLSVKGSRKIDLIPAEECKHQCKSLTVKLGESYLLWYNWWYWRPSVQSSFTNDTFIAHIGSYC